MKDKMQNNEWNIPSDYFEKNKKALMPIRKFPTGKWLLALAAACVIGVGFFMLKGDGRNQEIAQEQTEEGKRGEEGVREGKNGEDVGAKNLSPERREGKNEKYIGAKNLSPGISEGLKEIPREELVAYLLEEDSDLIENID
ncbi:MAG: hypothetical protein ACEQSL_02975 [Sediminibacterium sp.]